MQVAALFLMMQAEEICMERKSSAAGHAGRPLAGHILNMQAAKDFYHLLF